MMKRKLFLVLLFLVSVIPGAHAHILRVDGNIGVLLHVDPNDAPVAGQQANFFVIIQDYSGRFDISECYCTLAIKKDGKEIASFPINSNEFYRQIEYSFPASGIYQVIVAGKPTNGDFQPFKTTFEYYVSTSLGTAATATTQETNPMQNYLPYISLIAGLLILGMLVPRNARRSGSDIGAPATRIVYALAIIWACLLYFYVSYTIPDEATAMDQVANYYGLTALFMVFIVLIPGVVKVYFPGFAFNELLVGSRRALGISTFFFALFHSVMAYFYNLPGSIQSISYLPDVQRLSIIFSIIAFFVLFLMAITSWDKAIAWLGYKKWKSLHRFIYPAIGLVLLHTFMYGSHFVDPNALLPSLVISLALAFVLLEAGAAKNVLLGNKVPMQNRNKNVVYAALAVIVIGTFYSTFAGLVMTPSHENVQNIQQNAPFIYAVKGSIVSIDANAISVMQERGLAGLPPMGVTYSLDNLNGTRISDFSRGDNVILILKPIPNSPDDSQSVSRYVALINITKV